MRYLNVSRDSNEKKRKVNEQRVGFNFSKGFLDQKLVKFLVKSKPSKFELLTNESKTKDLRGVLVEM